MGRWLALLRVRAQVGQYPSLETTPLVAEKEYLLVTLDFLLGGGDVSASARRTLPIVRSGAPLDRTAHGPWQGYTMLTGAREVRLGWPVSNAALNLLRDAAVAANLTEPTEAMVLGSFLQRQALTATSGDVGITGRIRKIVGSVEGSLGSGSCCGQQCPLGRSDPPPLPATHPPALGPLQPPWLPRACSLVAWEALACHRLQVGCVGAAAQLLSPEQWVAHGRATSVCRFRRYARKGRGDRLRPEAHSPCVPSCPARVGRSLASCPLRFVTPVPYCCHPLATPPILFDSLMVCASVAVPPESRTTLHRKTPH
jgi:hypothetical protein